ncbi:sugar ABC transporter, partial [Escherichia coli]|nr:sugar ABC transporter [Escherichia coli]
DNVNLSVSIANQDLNKQLSDVEDFITKKVDAIIISPVLQSVVARVDGFKKGLSETPDIKIVAEQPGITRAEALT